MPPATKRKSISTDTGDSAKKAKLDIAATVALVGNILSDPKGFLLPATDNATRDALIQLAEYARGLEKENASFRPKERSPEELQEAADKLAAVVVNGITRQCGWKPSCKQGTTKWAYDGVCSDPAVFAKMLKLDGPLTFKAKKMSADEFQEKVGEIRPKTRYAILHISGNVNIQWKAEEGTFKFSGTYGLRQ